MTDTNKLNDTEICERFETLQNAEIRRTAAILRPAILAALRRTGRVYPEGATPVQLLREWRRETALLKSGGENDLSPEAYASQTAEEEAGQAHFQYWLGSDDKTIRLAERDRVAWLIAETIGRSLVEADIGGFPLHDLVTDGSENSEPLG